MPFILSIFEFISVLVTPQTWVSLLCGMLAVFCYGLFSRFYEPLTRSAEEPLLAAAVLYGGAAFILGIFVVFCLVLFGGPFKLPTSVTVFNITTSFTGAITALLLLIILMSLLYFAHIGTEASARKSINMGVYTLLFQINVLIIALTDWVVYRTPFSFEMVAGGLLILFSSATALLTRSYLLKRNGNSTLELEQSPQSLSRWQKRLVRLRLPFLQSIALRASEYLPTTVNRRVFLAIASAVTCGLALYIDGEIGRNYILKKSAFNTASLTPFLFYEMLTFGIPCLWTIFKLSRSKPLLKVLSKLKEEYLHHKLGYSLSSFFSAGQFVFSVLALSLPASRFLVAMVLALSPIFSIFLDRNQRTAKVRAFEYSCGVISAVGLVLLITANR